MSTPARIQRPQLLTTSQVAEQLAVDPRTVARWARERLLPVVVLPSGHRRFRQSDVDALLAPFLADDPEPAA